ncbi:MAG: acyl-CoA dehydrogenase family protein [Parabacteroides sp.]|nr:acyl-CoA dehydrogenase family protein [Parabacteroides sp.]
MDFQLSKTHQLLRQAVRDFTKKEVRPIARQLDEEVRYPVETIEKFFKYGYMSFLLKRELGGAGGDTTGYMICIEELAKGCPPTAGILSGHNEAAINVLQKWGTPYQQETYLTRLKTDTMGGFCLTEPTAGSDAGGLKTRAVLEGDHYVVNGTKCFVTNGGFAGIFILMAVTDPESKSGKSAFILDKNFEGVSVGKNENMMGFHAGSITELRLNNVKIPKENLLGQEGEGLRVALGNLEGGRVIVAAEALGLAENAMEEAIEFCNTHRVNGKLLSTYQHVQFKLAELKTQVDAARLLTYQGASLLDTIHSANLEAAQAKYFVTQTASDVSAALVELLGQHGYTNQYPIERYMRDAKLMEIYEGTNQIQKMVISRALGLITREKK